MSIDDVTREVPPWTSRDDWDPAAIRAQQLATAWDRVARDARQLVAVYQQARVPTVPAYYSATGRRGDRAWFPVWLISAYQPRHKGYTDTVDGRAMATTTLPEAPGIALLADATLAEYVVVKRKPMLTVPLRRARSQAPPGHAMFGALAAKVLN